MNHLYKYPRTPHLPWSPGGTSDDSYLFDTSHFEGKEVVITEKLDGENTSLYRDTMHARSVDGRHHPSRDWVKSLHSRIAYEIPEDWRICGENVYARHSIAYDDLSTYFYVFSIWTDENETLSWEETLEWCRLLDLETVPVFYQGIWDESFVREIEIDPNRQEGYVVRVENRFGYDDFPNSIAKFVREGHVQTDQHWMFAEIVPNQLREV